MTTITTRVTRYRIETRRTAQQASELAVLVHTGEPDYTRLIQDWTAHGVCEPNAFASEAEAASAIESLRGLGDEWELAEYRVVEVQS